jgi:hypothetical protein
MGTCAVTLPLRRWPSWRCSPRKSLLDKVSKPGYDTWLLSNQIETNKSVSHSPYDECRQGPTGNHARGCTGTRGQERIWRASRFIHISPDQRKLVGAFFWFAVARNRPARRSLLSSISSSGNPAPARQRRPFSVHLLLTFSMDFRLNPALHEHALAARVPGMANCGGLPCNRHQTNISACPGTCRRRSSCECNPSYG